MIEALQFELCAETMQACLAARAGGAHRIELCSALSEGGLTPGHALIRQAVLESHLPVHPILRPRAGDFVYTEAEFQLILEDLRHARDLGASGFVTGILTKQNLVDQARVEQVVALAAPLEVTFHRAIDCTANLSQSLEAVIQTGCRRVLTSGGAPTVLEGASTLAALVQQAAGRIRVAAGGGLRLASAAQVARLTRATAFHGSMRRPAPAPYPQLPGALPTPAWSVDPEDIRRIIQALSPPEA